MLNKQRQSRLRGARPASSAVELAEIVARHAEKFRMVEAGGIEPPSA